MGKRIVDFDDGFTSASAPTTSDIEAVAIKVNQYVDEAAYVTANGAAVNGAFFYDTTAGSWKHYEQGAWVATDFSQLAADIVSLQGEFNTSTGHEHDGVDSKKILGTNIDSTGGTSSQVLIADGLGGISWAAQSGGGGATTQSLTYSIGGSSMQDLTGELRWDAGLTTGVSDGSGVFTVVDDVGNTRTEFTASVECEMGLGFSSKGSTDDMSFKIVLNSATTVMEGTNGNTHGGRYTGLACAPIRLQIGDYLTVEGSGGTVLNASDSVFLTVFAIEV